MAGRTPLQAQMIVGDRYRLLRRIGADRAVETWEAHDARLDRPVAVRLMTDSAQADSDARAELRGVARESALAGAPSAAPRILDGGDDPNYGPFVVAELNAAFEATQRIPTIHSTSASAPATDPPTSTEHIASSFVPPPAVDAPPSIGPSARGSVLTPGVDARRSTDPASPTSIRAAAIDASRTAEPAARGAIPLAGSDAPRSSRGAARRGVAPVQVGRRTSGPIALALVVLAICALVGAVYAARSLTPSDTPGATAAPTTASASGSAQGPSAPSKTGSAPTPAPKAEATAAPAAAQATTAPAATSAPNAPAKPAPVAAQATSAAKPTATAAPAAAAGSPVDTIKQHYALIDARRFTESYQLMDARLRAENSQATYNSWFAGKVSLKPVSVDVISQDAQQATVRATVLSTDTVNGRNVTTQVTEQFVLRAENGAWRIDTVTRLQEQPVGANSGNSGNRNEDSRD